MPVLPATVPATPAPTRTPPPDAPPNTRDGRGRLTASAVFPARWSGHAVHQLRLADGERVRVVACAAAPHAAAPHASTPVICLHGLGACAYGFRHILGQVAGGHAGTAADAFAPDLRGHGWSDKPLAVTAYTPDALADWTVALLDALQVPRAVLVGHSLGGAIALHAARLAPDRVAALVLLAPLGLGTVARLEQLRRLTPDRADAWFPRIADQRVLTALAVHSAFGRLGRPTARDVDEYWAPTADPAFARAARLVVHADPWAAFTADVLAAVTHPVEVVAGTRDNLLRIPAVRQAVSAIPRGRLDVVREAGHVLADEVPDRVLAAIARAQAADAAR